MGTAVRVPARFRVSLDFPQPILPNNCWITPRGAAATKIWSLSLARSRSRNARGSVDTTPHCALHRPLDLRSEEHTSELQSLMRISYAVFCLKKKKRQIEHAQHSNTLSNNNNATNIHRRN